MIERSKEWWMSKARAEGESEVGAGPDADFVQALSAACWTVINGQPCELPRDHEGDHQDAAAVLRTVRAELRTLVASCKRLQEAANKAPLQGTLTQLGDWIGALGAFAADVDAAERLSGYEAPASLEAPTCTSCNTKMTLAFWDRPGGPPGNGWRCPKCTPKGATCSKFRPYEGGDPNRCRYCGEGPEVHTGVWP